MTDAIHMPRAQWAFQQTGLRVVPVPSHFVGSNDYQNARFIPNAQSLKYSHYAIHEWLGLLVYRLRYAVAD